MIVDKKDKSIRLQVLFFGAAREAVGGNDSLELTLPSPIKASELLAELLSSYSQLQRFGNSLLLAINQEYARMDQELKDGDEVAIFPPVSGGSEEISSNQFSKDFFEITEESIDVGVVARRIVPPNCGASVTLDGYVRNNTKDRKTKYLIYEAYVPMALKEMERLGREAHKRFTSISSIGIVHRIGRLEIGETSVVITVSAPHRREAFEACEWAIKELKRTVPIWKKEFFEDGEVWVEGEIYNAESLA
jgi:MoaE-MoaD fusion protein